MYSCDRSEFHLKYVLYTVCKKQENRKQSTKDPFREHIRESKKVAFRKH